MTQLAKRQATKSNEGETKNGEWQGLFSFFFFVGFIEPTSVGLTNFN